MDNGLPAAYDQNAPYAPVDFTPPVASLLPGNTAGLLEKLGFMDWFSMWYNILMRLLQNLKAMLTL